MLLALLTTGCLAAQTFTSARTLDPGKTEVTLVAGVSNADPGAEFGRMPIPALGVQVRHGALDGFEFGGAVGQLGLTGQLKWALLRTGTAAGGVSVALSPAAGFNPLGFVQTYGEWPGLLSAEFPILLGLHVGGGHELTLAPRARWTYGSGHHAITAGVTLGMALRLSELFVLTPELGVMVPVRDDRAQAPFIPSGGLGMTWGR